MNFEEMQVIWDSQNDRQVYGVDESGLHAIVRKRDRKLGLGVLCEEFGMILICLFVAANLANDPILRGTSHYKFIGAALFVGVAAYTWLNRVRRLRSEQGFESTLIGDLDRAIFRTDCQIRRSRTFLWWFMLPAALTVLVGFALSPIPKPLWIWGIVLFSFVLGYGVTQLALRCQLPQRRELETLREKLSMGS